MARKGGLGVSQPAQVGEDLLGNLFGSPEAESAKTDSPKDDRVGKYFKIDRELAVKIKIYAAKCDMKDHQVVNAALRAFFADKPE